MEPESQTAILILLFISTMLVTCFVCWRTSGLEMSFLEFFDYAFNLRKKFLYAKREELQWFDHPRVRSARLLCVVVGVTLMGGHYLLRHALSPS